MRLRQAGEVSAGPRRAPRAPAMTQYACRQPQARQARAAIHRKVANPPHEPIRAVVGDGVSGIEQDSIPLRDARDFRLRRRSATRSRDAGARHAIAGRKARSIRPVAPGTPIPRLPSRTGRSSGCRAHIRARERCGTGRRRRSRTGGCARCLRHRDPRGIPGLPLR